MTLDLKSNELEHKFIKERVSSVEKHFLDISSKMSSYAKHLASLRDSGDEVAKSISGFASAEKYNQTLRLSMGEFSDVLSSIQEYRDAQIKRIQVKVINELTSFPPVCKQAKTEIKKSFDAREKVLKRKTELEKLRSKSTPSWEKIAEKDVNQAQIEATNATQDLSKQVENFERKKIKDLKKMFQEFVKIEMIFHCKAIELYTKSYNILAKIEEDEDLEEFKSYFRGLNCNTNMVVPQASPPTNSITNRPLPNPVTPKVVNEQGDISPLQQVLAFESHQGHPRSIFTMKNNAANDEASCSSIVTSTTACSGSKIEE